MLTFCLQVEDTEAAHQTKDTLKAAEEVDLAKGKHLEARVLSSSLMLSAGLYLPNRTEASPVLSLHYVVIMSFSHVNLRTKT